VLAKGDVMPETFRAAVCTALTGPDAVVLQDLPVLPLTHGEVRIAVQAAGLNFPDLLMTRGGYQFRPDPPFIPGMEIAGKIIEIAEDVVSISIGDRVMSGAKGGGFAEQLIVPCAAISALPQTFSFEEGACWRGAAVTAWHALHDKAGVRPGETVLVLGASGGVGLAAVKLAKHFGATVIGTGSTPAKRLVIAAAGADHALDPANPDLAKDIKALTGGAGVDVVYDPVGGELAITATRAIAWGGRYLIVGFASGTVPQFPANHAMIKGYSLIGLRAGESSRRDPALAARTQKALADLALCGVMRPHISHRFPLERAADALRALENRSVIGRAVITI
jgi:NADPH:quinone reductase